MTWLMRGPGGGLAAYSGQVLAYRRGTYGAPVGPVGPVRGAASPAHVVPVRRGCGAGGRGVA